MLKKKHTCECGKEFVKYNTLQKYCSYKCSVLYSKKTKLKPKKSIKKVSEKQKNLNSIYRELSIEFLSKEENKICPVTQEPATEIHHKKGRKGYADDFARDNKIPLIIDVRFFLAVSRRGHIIIENNPEWAKENGYSLKRI